MARIRCRCGAELNNQEVPNEIQLRMYTDNEWDKIFDCESINPWMIPLPQYDVWKCPKCQRLYFYEEGNDNPVKVYCLEDEV